MTFPPASHRDDPATSHLAEREHTSNGKRQTHAQQVEGTVLLHPGRTAAEIGELTRLGRYEAARRLSDLKDQGRVVQGPARECSVAGNRQVTWHPAPPPEAKQLALEMDAPRRLHVVRH